MMNQQGGVSRSGLLIAILVIALIVVLFMWQRDREAKDVEIDIGRAVPELTGGQPGMVA